MELRGQDLKIKIFLVGIHEAHRGILLGFRSRAC